jgi:multidrug efflux pump subunit AcrA (membrane-fusion protein)
VNPDGTKRVASATQRESYGNDDTTLGSNPRGDETIATEEEKADGVEGTDNDELMEEVTINSTQTNRTSKSFRSARSLARERQQIEDRAQFNAALVNIQDHNRLQQEASRKEIEELKLQLQRQNITQPPVTQPTPTGESIETSTNSSISSKEEEDEEDEELMEAQDWMQRNNIPLPMTKEEEEETPPADPPNDESENGAEESPPPAL